MRLYTEEPDILSSRWPRSSAVKHELVEYVRPIVSNVAQRGDNAVRTYTERFDNVKLDRFKVSRDEVQAAYQLVPQSQVAALRESRRRLEIVESKRLTQSIFRVDIDGTEIKWTVRPIQSAGCYVPGGKAAYPSSVIMNVTPAKVAGVEKIIVCTPPGAGGEVNSLVLVACDICMVDEVYKVGGAQAIAAMAYGTESVPRVEKIVGPGNKYVTAAKNLVSDVVSIDKPAGPSEVLIIADETADPNLVAVDLISQAEHGPGGISGLVTTSEKMADDVAQLIEEKTPTLIRRDIVHTVLDEKGFIYLVSTMEEAIDFTNRFAPEHLEIMTGVPEEVAEKITGSGLILLGDYSLVSSTDYCMGVNHVLPTGGYARVASGITILDYMKPVSVVKATKTGLGSVRERVGTLADAEGLPNHRLAVEARFK
jgi:histidinol dehydrogenase